VPASRYHLVLLLAALAGVHLLTARASEPFFNNDEIRHTMTGVFVRDALCDLPASATDPKGYAVRYYLQYPALGLITWPPLFYLIEGAAMLAFGPTFLVGRLCVAAFAVWLVVSAYRFARLHLPHFPALFAAGLVGLSPYVLIYSQRVMLEIPTFAFALAAVVRFEHHLRDRRGRDAVLACLFAACAALTRFDGVFLLPYFGLRLLFAGQLKLLFTRPVIAGVTVAAVLVVPYYLLTFREYGGGIGTAAGTGTQPDKVPLYSPERFVFYPSAMVYLVGWPFAVVGFLGLALALIRRPFAVGPAFALLAAVYLTFTPLAEIEARHSIYWVAGWAVPVAWLVSAAFALRRWLGVLLAVGLVCGTGYELWRYTFRYVRGYEDAARWVLDHRQTDRPILADGELSGSVVYHVRLHDPARRVTVLRGDKVLYAMFSDPTSAYTEFARTPAEVLATLHDYDPEFVVVEDPAPAFRDAPVPGAELLARTLRANRHLYDPVEVIPIRTNYDRFEGTALVIYRTLARNPNPKPVRALAVPGLGKSVGD
jgi:hypothetical protein